MRRDPVEDDATWLARHGLTLAGLAEPRARALVPETLHGLALTTLLRTPAGLLGIYDGRYLRLTESATTLVLDTIRYHHGPADRPNSMPEAFSDAEYADLIAQRTGWAVRAGDILFFDSRQLTYAADSGGRTAYLTAWDLVRQTLRWRSPPLVARARNFLVLGPVVVAGYGMTAEPDVVSVLDAETGAVLQRLPVRSAPDLFAARGDRLHVACYDADVTFAIER